MPTHRADERPASGAHVLPLAERVAFSMRVQFGGPALLIDHAACFARDVLQHITFEANQVHEARKRRTRESRAGDSCLGIITHVERCEWVCDAVDEQVHLMATGIVSARA
jgi:hypothetical protein